MMTIMTNCLTSKGIVHELLDPAQRSQLNALSKTLAWFDENLQTKLFQNSDMSRAYV